MRPPGISNISLSSDISLKIGYSSAARLARTSHVSADLTTYVSAFNPMPKHNPKRIVNSFRIISKFIPQK